MDAVATTEAKLSPRGANLIKVQRQAERLSVEAEQLGHPDAMRMRQVSDMLASERPTFESLGTRGTLSSSQIDKIIREQLRPKIYTASGQPSHAMYAQP